MPEFTHSRPPENGESLPLLVLKSTVLFPLQVVSVQISQKRNSRLLEDYVGTDRVIGVGTLIDPEGRFTRANLGPVAVSCRILSSTAVGNGVTHVALQGFQRSPIAEVKTVRPYVRASIRPFVDPPPDSARIREMVASLIRLAEGLVAADESCTEELVNILRVNASNGSRCADLVADMVPFGYGEKRRVLEALDVAERLAIAAELVQGRIDNLRLAGELRAKTEASISRQERAAFLREHLEVIRRELSELDPTEGEIDLLVRRVGEAGIPPAVVEEVTREIQRLKEPNLRAGESAAIRRYVEWVESLPWRSETRDRLDLRRARRILDARYFGLGTARDRLLEFLAVRKLGGNSQQRILGIVGPPGTGRTSLARTLAEILGRRFVRIPMDGARGQDDICGTRRVTSGAHPGMILGGLAGSGARNPLILLDDIDQIDEEDEEALAALTDAASPVRNSRFLDKYLGVPFDLSGALFVIAANMDEAYPEPLWDLIHYIELSGYTEKVKLAIARESIWPQVLGETGLTHRDVRLTTAALRQIIRKYTREAGVGELKKKLETICRQVAVKVASAKSPRIAITATNVVEYLRKPVYPEASIAKEAQIGAATGLAWTEAGGDLLPIEALLMPGEGWTTLTGLLGEVMEESVEAALSYVRSCADELGIPRKILEKEDLHVHFPEGAIPKDGPSAGIAVATAIASLFSNRAVRPDIAMTGEISLRGRVLPVGGLREKVLAAYRAGIRRVILPKGNESDLDEIPEEIRRHMKLHLVAQANEVFAIALEKRRAPDGKGGGSGRSRRRAAARPRR